MNWPPQDGYQCVKNNFSRRLREWLRGSHLGNVDFLLLLSGGGTFVCKHNTPKWKAITRLPTAIYKKIWTWTQISVRMNILVNFLFPVEKKKTKAQRDWGRSAQSHQLDGSTWRTVRHDNAPSLVAYDSFSQPTFSVHSRVTGTRRTRIMPKGYIV